MYVCTYSILHPIVSAIWVADISRNNMLNYTHTRTHTIRYMCTHRTPTHPPHPHPCTLNTKYPPHTCMHIHTHSHSHTRTLTNTHTYAHSHTHAHTHTHTHTHTCTHARTLKHTHTYVHSHACTHVCTHTSTCLRLMSWRRTLFHKVSSKISWKASMLTTMWRAYICEM